MKSGVNDEPKMHLSVGMRRNSSTTENNNNNAQATATATSPEGRGLPRRESTKRISLVSLAQKYILIVYYCLLHSTKNSQILFFVSPD